MLIKPSNHRISIDRISCYLLKFAITFLSVSVVVVVVVVVFFFPSGSDHSLTPIGVQEQGWGSHDISRIMLKRKNEELRLSRPPHSQAEHTHKSSKRRLVQPRNSIYVLFSSFSLIFGLSRGGEMYICNIHAGTRESS